MNILRKKIKVMEGATAPFAPPLRTLLLYASLEFASNVKSFWEIL
jgi:hypothetical protein